jgi:hypothetical protein
LSQLVYSYLKNSDLWRKVHDLISQKKIKAGPINLNDQEQFNCCHSLSKEAAENSINHYRDLVAEDIWQYPHQLIISSQDPKVENSPFHNFNQKS